MTKGSSQQVKMVPQELLVPIVDRFAKLRTIVSTLEWIGDGLDLPIRQISYGEELAASERHTAFLEDRGILRKLLREVVLIEEEIDGRVSLLAETYHPEAGFPFTAGTVSQRVRRAVSDLDQTQEAITGLPSSLFHSDYIQREGRFPHGPLFQSREAIRDIWQMQHSILHWCRTGEHP